MLFQTFSKTLLGGLPATVADWVVVLPRINAAFNGLAAVLLTAGYLAIRRQQVSRHRACMLAALTSSALFLVGYLTRMGLSGPHTFAGEGWMRVVYRSMLYSHMFLAVVMLPMIFRALYLAWRGRFAAHRRLARWTWPIWMYVSVTGVGVYVALYHISPSLAARP